MSTDQPNSIRDGQGRTPIICSICHNPIEIGPGGWRHGHNAEPVNDGRCCTECNDSVVIPRRISDMHRAARMR